MIDLFGRTPCLLVIAIRPDTWMISGPTVSIASSSPSVVETVITGPPRPPDTPFWPRVFSAAKPSGRPVAAGGVVVAGVPGSELVVVVLVLVRVDVRVVRVVVVRVVVVRVVVVAAAAKPPSASGCGA